MNRKTISQLVITIGLLSTVFMFPATFQLDELEGLGGVILTPLIFALYLFLFIIQIASLVALAKSKNPGLLIFLSVFPAWFLSTATYEYQDSFINSIPMFVLLFSILLSYILVNSKDFKKPKYFFGFLIVVILYGIITTSYSILDEKNAIKNKNVIESSIQNASNYSDCDSLSKFYQVLNCAESVLEKTDDIIGCINYSADVSPRFEDRFKWFKSGFIPCSYMGAKFSKVDGIMTISGNWSTYSNTNYSFMYRNGFNFKESDNGLVVNPNIYTSPSLSIQIYEDTIDNVENVVSTEYAKESTINEPLNSATYSTINGREAKQIRFSTGSGFDDVVTFIEKNGKVYRIKYSEEENSELFEILLNTFKIFD